jgi:hypothetical protein
MGRLRKTATISGLRKKKSENSFGKKDSNVLFLIALKTEMKKRTKVGMGRLKGRPGGSVMRTICKALNADQTTVSEQFAPPSEEGERRMSAS